MVGVIFNMHERPKINIEMTSDLDLVISSAFDLYNVPRQGWLDRGVNPEKVENVGQHTEALADLFEQLIEKIDPEKRLDRVKMMRLIQIHDWPESIAGDQVAYNNDPQKRAELQKKKEADELKAMQEICNRFGEKGKIFMDLWLEYEHGSTPEAKIIKQLDKVQFFIKAYEYESLGENIDTFALIQNEKERGRITNSVLKKFLDDIEEKCRK